MADKIKIYTDGSSFKTFSGWGALIISENGEKEISGFTHFGNIQEMELVAIIEALNRLPDNSNVDVYTDQKFIVSTMKGKKTYSRKYKTLWQKLLEISKKHIVNWVWVKSHNGNGYHNKADKLAKKARKSIIKNIEGFKMNDLMKVFNYEGNKVRTLVRNEEFYWVACDVCKVLGYTNPSKALTDNVDPEDITTGYTLTNGGQQNVKIINESGLYSLILRSNMSKAKEFKRWITSEVIPSIRKTGVYSISTITEPLQALAMMNQQVGLIIQEMTNIKTQTNEAFFKVNEVSNTINVVTDTVTTIKERVNNLDAVNVNGNLRQKLNDLVRKYAWKTGKSFGVAWNNFKKAYNKAYKTNLEASMYFYKVKNNIKKVTIPEYLESSGKLDDALRIVDKLIYTETVVE